MLGVLISLAIFSAGGDGDPQLFNVMKAYDDCVQAAAIRLDDGRENVETITRAAMFACASEHDAIRVHLRTMMRETLTAQGRPESMANPEVGTAISAQMIKIENIETGKLPVLLLSRRAKK